MLTPQQEQMRARYNALRNEIELLKRDFPVTYDYSSGHPIETTLYGSCEICSCGPHDPPCVDKEGNALYDRDAHIDACYCRCSNPEGRPEHGCECPCHT